MAIFSPLADLKAQSTIESLGLWSGRGCCIIVRDDFAAWSPRCQAGTLLHEAAHAIEHLIQPDALATELSPICREWLEVGESKMLADAGLVEAVDMEIDKDPKKTRKRMNEFPKVQKIIIFA